MQLYVVVEDGVACAVRAEANVPQVKNACDDPKQLLSRKKRAVRQWQNQWRTCLELTLVLISSILMICRAFLTVFQSFLSLMEDTTAHCP